MLNIYVWFFVWQMSKLNEWGAYVRLQWSHWYLWAMLDFDCLIVSSKTSSSSSLDLPWIKNAQDGASKTTHFNRTEGKKKKIDSWLAYRYFGSCLFAGKFNFCRHLSHATNNLLNQINYWFCYVNKRIKYECSLMTRWQQRKAKKTLSYKKYDVTIRLRFSLTLILRYMVYSTCL